MKAMGIYQYTLWFNIPFISLLDHSESAFLYQPYNISIYEGEDTKYNCTPAHEENGGIAIWVINGQRYYWTDFLSIPTYSFDLRDNSLTIHNVSQDLDGVSYQCIINRRASRVAYLTVQYYSLNTSTFIAQQTTAGGNKPPCISYIIDIQ